MKRNNGNHPTLNLDFLSNKTNSSKRFQPKMSPIYNSATFIDTSKIPKDWMYWETPNGNILDWARYPHYEKYSRKDKAKYGHSKHEDCFSTKVASQVMETTERSIMPVCKDTAEEKAKYDWFLYNKTSCETPLTAVAMSFYRMNVTKPALKPALKSKYQKPQRQVKMVRFADKIKSPTTTIKPVTKVTKPTQASKFKRTTLNLSNIAKHLPSIPSPHSIKFSTIMTTKVWTDKARRYLTNDPPPDHCPTPTTPEYTWFDPVNFREVHVYADGKQRAQMGSARIMK